MMLKKIPKSVKNLIYPFIAVGFLMLFWYLLAVSVGKELVVPSPESTFRELGKIFGSEDFFKISGGTLLRSFESFAISAAAAFVFALLGSLSEVIRKLLAPFVTVFRAVPTMSVILLSVIWLKPSWSPILVSFLISFPVLYAGFLSAFLSIDKKLVEMSKVYRVPFLQRFKGLYLPSVLPNALDTLGATASLNVKIVISAEVLASTANSIGMMMHLDKIYLETASLLAWTLVAVGIGYLFEGLFFALKKCFVRWK